VHHSTATFGAACHSRTRQRRAGVRQERASEGHAATRHIELDSDCTCESTHFGRGHATRIALAYAGILPWEIREITGGTGGYYSASGETSAMDGIISETLEKLFQNKSENIKVIAHQGKSKQLIKTLVSKKHALSL